MTSVVILNDKDYLIRVNETIDKFISEFSGLSLSKFINIKHTDDVIAVKSNYFRSYLMNINDIHSNNLFTNVQQFILESIYKHINKNYQAKEIGFEEFLLILDNDSNSNRYILCDNAVYSKLNNKYFELINNNKHLVSNSDFFLKNYNFIKDFPEGICFFDPNLIDVQLNLSVNEDIKFPDENSDQDNFSLMIGIDIFFYNLINYYKIKW